MKQEFYDVEILFLNLIIVAMAIGAYRFKVNVSVVAFYNREINGVQGGSMKLRRMDGHSYLFAIKNFNISTLQFKTLPR